MSGIVEEGLRRIVKPAPKDIDLPLPPGGRPDPALLDGRRGLEQQGRRAASLREFLISKLGGLK